MEPRISIVTIAAENVERLGRFYEAMGLKRHPGFGDDVEFFQIGGAILALFRRKDAEADSGIAFADGPSRVYLAYNTRSDAEVDEVLALAQKSGGRVVKPAGRAFWGGWYGYFADPEDNLWEVAHNPDFPIDSDGRISLPE
jgi:catechol 2,3-dioxygenase-like lactoylglutathione lyase family enzyme